MTLWSYQSLWEAPYVYEDRPAQFQQWQGFHEEILNLRLHHPTRLVNRLSFLVTHTNSARGDHLGSLGLHLVNMGLMAAVVTPVLGGVGTLAAVAIFALHPIQVESVAYAANRPDLLVGTGILLTLLGASTRRHWLMVVGVVVAALSKETGIMALPLALLWLWQSGQALPSRRVLFVSGAILAILVAGIAQQFPGSLAGPDEASLHGTMLWRLLALVVWPVGFTVDHDWSWLTPQIAAFGAMAWIGVAYWALMRPTWLTFGLIWPLVAILPRLFAHEAEPLHEHHLYGPMLGVSMGLAGWWPVAAGSCHYWLRALKCALVGHTWVTSEHHCCMRCHWDESSMSGRWIAREFFIRRTLHD